MSKVIPFHLSLTFYFSLNFIHIHLLNLVYALFIHLGFPGPFLVLSSPLSCISLPSVWGVITHTWAVARPWTWRYMHSYVSCVERFFVAGKEMAGPLLNFICWWERERRIPEAQTQGRWLACILAAFIMQPKIFEFTHIPVTKNQNWKKYTSVALKKTPAKVSLIFAV